MSSPTGPFVLTTCIALLLCGVEAQSAVVTGNEANADNAWTLPSGTNLLIGASVAPATPNAHEGSSTSWGTLTDGILGAKTALNLSVTPNNNDTVTYSFDLSGANSGGYSLTSFDSYCAWQDPGRDDQDYTIAYSTVGAPETFINFATVVNDGGLSATHTSLTDTTGLLGAANVAAIRITFGANQENGYTGFREFVALGQVTTPDLTWTGASGAGGDSIWTSGADSNWLKTSDSGAQTYGSGGLLVFNTAGANSNITVQAGGVSTIGMSFTNDETKAYTLSGGSITTGAVNVSGAGNVTINSAIISRGGVIKSGAGTLTLAGANTYAGVTTLAGGILNVATLSDYGVAGSLGQRYADFLPGNVGILFRGGTLQYTGSTAQSTNRSIRISTAGGATIDASGSNPAATLSFTATASPDFYENPGGRTLTLTGTNTGANTFAMNITDQDPNTGRTNVTKIGDGTWHLTGASSYNGVTTIAGGILNVASLADYGIASALGDRTSTQDVSTNIGILFRGGTLQYTGSTPQSTNRAIRVSTVGGATIDASGSNPDATLSFTAASSPDFFETGGNRSLTFTGTNTGNNTFNMLIEQTAVGLTTVNKNGPGTWVLGGANVYGGQTNLNAGVLRITNSASLGIGSFAVATKTTISNGATLELQGDLTVPEHFHVAGAGVGGNGAIRSLSGNSTLSQDSALDGDTTIGVDAGTLTISGGLYDEFGNNFGITKVGAGTLVLSGNNIHTGLNQVNAGTLLVNGSALSSSTAVNLGGTLGGSGTMGAVNVLGGTFAPGTSPGTLTTGNLSLGLTSLLHFELTMGNVTAGGGINDLAIVNGDLTLDGILHIDELGGSLINGSVYTLFDYSGILTNNGLELELAFANAHPGATVFIDEANTQVLLSVPEPTSTLLLGGVGILFGLRRNRRQQG